MDDDLDGNEEGGGERSSSAGSSLSSPSHNNHDDRHDRRRHLLSIAALCLCAFTHAYLLISVFPYSGFLAMTLAPNVDTDTAGYYAGWISSSFMFGRAFGSYPWGRAADSYGRKAVLRTSLCLSGLATVWFGMSRSLKCALTARFVLGLSNGMPGAFKTLASELARGNAEREARGMGLIFSMWGVGFLLSPAVGGWLAEPLEQYPDAAWVRWAWLHPVLVRFPFLLPNLVGAMCCAVSWAGVTCLIEETLPPGIRRGLNHLWTSLAEGLRRIVGCSFLKSKQSISDEILDEGEVTNLLLKGDSTKRNNYEGTECSTREHVSDCLNDSTQSEQCTLTQQQESGNQAILFNENNDDDESSPASIASLWRRKQTRYHLTAYWLYSFVIICIDEAFPLFCMSKGGGLGISESTIGKVLSASGLLYAPLQYWIYSAIVHRWGVYPALKAGGLVSVLLVMVIPLSVPLNASTIIPSSAVPAGRLSTATFAFLSTTLATVRIFSMIFQSCITIATNATVPPSHRATANGLSMLGGSVAKGIGPAFAGWLVSYSLSSGVADPETGGSTLIFGGIGGLDVVVSVYACTLGPARLDTQRVRE